MIMFGVPCVCVLVLSVQSGWNVVVHERDHSWVTPEVRVVIVFPVILSYKLAHAVR